MRSLAPDELPGLALRAIKALLRADGEDPANWSARYVWDSGRGFTVVMRWSDELRAYTIGRRGEGFEAWVR